MAAVDPGTRIRHPLDVFHSTFNPDGTNVAAGMVPMADGLGQVEYVDSTTFGSTDAADINVADAGGFWVGTEVEAVLAEIGAGMRGYQNHGNAGSTETVTFVTGHHRLVLDANLTITFTGAVSGDSYWTVIDFVGDGTVRTLAYSGTTVSGTVTLDSTLNAVTRVLYNTVDGGTNATAMQSGGGGSALEIAEEGTPVTSAATSIDFVGAGVTATAVGDAVTVTVDIETAGRWELAVITGSPPDPLYADGDYLYIFVP